MAGQVAVAVGPAAVAAGSMEVAAVDGPVAVEVVERSSR